MPRDIAIAPDRYDFGKWSDVADFKQVTRYRMTGLGTFEKVGPDGELKHAKLTYFFQDYNCATLLHFVLSLGDRPLPETPGWMTPKDVVRQLSMAGMIGSATFDQLVVPVFFVMIVGFAARYGLVKRMPHGEPKVQEGPGETPASSSHD